MKQPKVGDTFLQVATNTFTITEVLDYNSYASTAKVKDENGRVLLIKSAPKAAEAPFIAILELDEETK